MKRYLDRELHL